MKNTASLSGFLSPKRLATKDPKKLQKQNSNSSLNKSLKVVNTDRMRINQQQKIQTPVKDFSKQRNIATFKKPFLENYIENDEQDNGVDYGTNTKSSKYSPNKGYLYNPQKAMDERKQQEMKINPLQLRHVQSYNHDEQLSPRPTLQAKVSSKNNANYKLPQMDTFYSSRLQAKQCIEGLSKKIGNQINILHSTIDEFNKRIRRTVEIEYQKLKQLIRSIVEEIFEASEEGVRNLYKNQQKNVNDEFYEVNQNLESMYQRLQKMKEGIESSNWKRTAGELLATDVQREVNDLVQHCQKLNVYRNVKLQADGKRLNTFEESLQRLMELNLSSTIQTRRTTFTPS